SVQEPTVVATLTT
nr:immunoglobulin heavy chain junction region [Mus musculus]